MSINVTICNTTKIKYKELSVFVKTFFFKFITLALLLLLGCRKDKIERNPYLPDINFNISLNLNLPSYDNLRYAGGGQSIRQGGINGLLVFNLNGNDFLAWEATCPNHPIRDCSDLSITGVLAECSCEGFKYSLATGQLLNPKMALKTPIPCCFITLDAQGITLILPTKPTNDEKIDLLILFWSFGISPEPTFRVGLSITAKK